MKPARVMIYLMIFIVFGLFYYFYEIRSGGEKQRLIEAQQQIFNLGFDSITEIKYRNQGIDFHFQKDDRNWRMIEPIYTPADDWVLEGLIREALTGKKERVFPGEILDESQYGLDNPNIVLNLIQAGDGIAVNPEKQPGHTPWQESTLMVGRVNPTGQFFFAKLKNKPELFTISTELGMALSKKLYDLRDKSLLLFPGENIDTLILTAKGHQSVELKKKSLREWEVVAPEKTAADNDVVQKLIYYALKGQVTEFVKPGPPGEDKLADKNHLPDQWILKYTGTEKDVYGFSPPRVHLQISSEDWPVGEVFIGDPKKSSDQNKKLFWAKSTERKDLMLINQGLVKYLDLTLFDLKDRHVLDIDRENIKAFEIISSQTTFKARYIDQEWIIDSPPGSSGRQADILGFLMDMQELRYMRILETDPEPGRAHDLIIKLIGTDDGERVLSIDLTPGQDKLIPARVGQGQWVLIDRDYLINALPREVRPEGPPSTIHNPGPEQTSSSAPTRGCAFCFQQGPNFPNLTRRPIKMAGFTVEDCLEQAPGRLDPVRVAVRRTRQLRPDSTALPPRNNKKVSPVLRQIASGRITFKNIYEPDLGLHPISVLNHELINE